MLQSQKNRERRRTSTAPRTSTTRRRPGLSKVDAAFRQKSQSGGGYLNYILFGGFAMILITFIIFVMSLNSNANTEPPFDPEHIKQLVDDAKMIPKQPKQPKQPNQAQITYTVQNPNAVKVTFRIYRNPTCDESDPSQYLTITKESSVKYNYNHDILALVICVCIEI